MSDKNELASVEGLEREVVALTEAVTKAQSETEQQYKDLHGHFDGVKAENAELKSAVEKHTADYAEMVAKQQTLEAALDVAKRQLDAPINKSGSERADRDRELAIKIQKSAFEFKGGEAADFKVKEDELIEPDDYRSAVTKLMRVGLQSKAEIVKNFNEGERKAFSLGNLDMAMFSPEILGFEQDCDRECAYMLDLYGQDTVSKSTFKYPHIKDYGAIGSYSCPAKCDAELGPEGNISYLNGETHDFRGVFCFNREVLREANYDLLSFMMRSAMRSHRINRNKALIMGDGINEPKGWLTGDLFDKVTGPVGTVTPQSARQFITSVPMEYGDTVTVMHQNMFAYLAASVDSNGRFIFGDGDMTYSPAAANERIRISNCLPDATEGGTLGSDASPFAADSFIMATANWETAYRSVSKRPMFMEQYEGGSTAWCVQYQFGAQDGGFGACGDAGRILIAG